MFLACVVILGIFLEFFARAAGLLLFP